MQCKPSENTYLTYRLPTRSAGFSLIEILIAIAIVIAVGAIVAVNFMPVRDQADIDLTRTQIDRFEDALELFKLDMKRYPTEEEGLRVLWNKDALEDEDDAARWKDTYLNDAKPNDTWGNAWVYRNPSEIRGDSFYDILSLGPDGEEGNDDITNHDDKLDSEGELVDEEFDALSGGDE